jgi:putative ABC transport system permease protein
MKFFGLIVRNALRNRRRTVLTILSIAVSLFMLATLRTILTELERPEAEEGLKARRIVVRRATSLVDPLPESHRETLRRIPGVVLVNTMNWFGGIYRDEKNFFANFAVDPEAHLAMWPEYHTSPAQAAAWMAERTAAMAGRRLAGRFGWKLGDRITLVGTIYPVDLEFTLRALYTGPDETAFFFHRAYLEEALGRPGRVGTFWLLAESNEAVPRIIETVDAAFRNTNAETKTETERAFQLGFVQMLGNVKGLIAAISTVVVFAICLVTANTMAMAIRERTAEIAILKTLGFGARRILGLLLAESAGVALVGGLLGAGGAFAFYRTVDVWRLTQGFFRRFELRPDTLAAGLVLAILIGLVSAAIPAGRAVRRPIAESLRHIG